MRQDTSLRNRRRTEWSGRQNRPNPSEGSRRSALAPIIALIGVIVVAVAVLAIGSQVASSISPAGTPSILNFDSLVESTVDLMGGSSFGGSAEPVETEPTASPSPTPEPTPTPQPTVAIAEVTGDPNSGSDMLGAWTRAGFKAEQVPIEFEQLEHVGGNVVGVSLVKGQSRLMVALLVYPDRQALQGEWNTSGEKPAPKAGLPLPSHETAWWNRNVIALVLERSGGSSEALAAFFEPR